MRERSSAIRTHQLFQIMSSSKREAIGQPSTKLYSMLFQFYDKYSMHPTHLSTNFHHYIYLLQPRTSRRRSPPQNYPIVTPPCPTPFKHIIPRLSMCTRYPCRGMNHLIGSCMSQRSCVVMGPRWEASKSIVHCVGGSGTVCFGRGVVIC